MLTGFEVMATTSISDLSNSTCCGNFLEAPGKVFSRDELIDAAWPDNIHIGERTVDVHISRMRKALKAASPGSVIRTVRSAGYSLEKPDD
ncbi:winged helix-turn-helix domain-containing protein [Mesorhizobium sp. M1342]|uniref:winged helix-turn-helix domain-containing protein n=1 Tax=Mesorhizobium sp. M1342 TaxID=2957088 RepID=UPI00333A9050